jgi:hypothetical protein
MTPDEQRIAMSDTPRTDEQINGFKSLDFRTFAGRQSGMYRTVDSLCNAAVPSEFARTLERELNNAQDRIKRMENQIETFGRLFSSKECDNPQEIIDILNKNFGDLT